MILFALWKYSCTDKTVVICDHFVSTLNKYAMVIDRKEYLDKLYSKRWNGKVKIITGIRRDYNDIYKIWTRNLPLKNYMLE